MQTGNCDWDANSDTFIEETGRGIGAMVVSVGLLEMHNFPSVLHYSLKKTHLKYTWVYIIDKATKVGYECSMDLSMLYL